MANILARREHQGAAPSTTLSAQIVNGTDTTFTITSGTNWPTGSVGNFIVTIDRGQATEERILCASRSGTTVTVAASGRGYDGTTAQAHASGATAEHTTAGVELDELNVHGNSTTGVHGVAGSVVGTSDTQTLTGKTVNLGSNTVTGTTAQFNAALTDNDFATLAGSETLTNKTINGAVLDAATTHGGVAGTTLAAATAAYTAFTPTATSGSFGTGATAFGRYSQIGKTVIVNMKITFGTTPTWTGGIAFPVTPRDGASDVDSCLGTAMIDDVSAGSLTGGIAQAIRSGASQVIQFRSQGGGASGAAIIWSNTAPYTLASGDLLWASFAYEAA